MNGAGRCACIRYMSYNEQLIALLMISDAVEQQGAAACLLRPTIDSHSCLHLHAVAHHTRNSLQCLAVAAYSNWLWCTALVVSLLSGSAE